ncbi:hypothetical protein FLAG1_07912 [Fusarium langsethiae]|uniref:FAS1 domain-containing protein n=1 Tax=Fusarium langsethiae TaxID=179993 RepID=A0A0M9ETA4_FUSLA|nr:hypothetical protein FLAG1_07912 [Fusarium langsethiae]GKU06165.1 unnamed protein product [Fusarium langsethiae]GKU22678.1 unnamed protein product [Fusarium langsethiae]
MINFFKTALYASLLCMQASAKVDRTNAVITVLEQHKDLTTFYNLFASTGHGTGIPEPAFEARFNDNNKDQAFTILAPTNEAIAKVPGLAQRLSSPAGYPLLAALLRTHILPGKLSPQQLYGKTITAIEGFSIDINTNGAITTNAGMTSLTESAVRAGTQAKILKDRRGRAIRIPASNGVVYKIDNILDPMLTYFGEDAPSHEFLPVIKYSRSKTMKDILATDPQTRRARQLLRMHAPHFLYDRLDTKLAGKDNSKVVFLVPSNEALKLFTKKVEDHGNTDITKFFLAAGYGTMEGNTIKGRAGFMLEIEGGRVMNTQVEKRECGSNGCVWRIGRVIDSVYGTL